MINRLGSNAGLAQMLLRLGLAFVFGYAGLASLLQPLDWAGYLPGFIAHVIDPVTAIKIVGVYELALAIWLLSGKCIRYSAGLAVLTLGGIIISNLNVFIITFRDIGLLCAALALALLSTSRNERGH